MIILSILQNFLLSFGFYEQVIGTGVLPFIPCVVISFVVLGLCSKFFGGLYDR